ncbi:ATP-dependent Clp protease ATP-binding subunit, partial [Lactobacillus sp. XV13L]|nr:ATP-dependent Clp protease ATP-binding subunit [Lactobacillus sp. XV13L]
TSVNGRRAEVNLCQNCYQKLREQQGQGANSMMYNDPFGFGDLSELFGSIDPQQAALRRGQEVPSQTAQGGGHRRGGNGILDQYGVDLTAQAKAGKIDPVIGRDQEISRVIEILNRRTKNNPVLIGEAGVGKTAVVEGLAQKIVDSQVPEKLQNKRVIRLDVVSLVQGTGVRGQFEQRMQQLIKELHQNKNIILFIDEIHEI